MNPAVVSLGAGVGAVHHEAGARTSLRHDLRDRLLSGAFEALTVPVHLRSSCSTDAPYRETATAIAHARELGIACVEMEAALYAVARAAAVVCFAHITNTMATDGDDFEKGENAGVDAALALARAAALALT